MSHPSQARAVMANREADSWTGPWTGRAAVGSWRRATEPVVCLLVLPHTDFSIVIIIHWF